MRLAQPWGLGSNVLLFHAMSRLTGWQHCSIRIDNARILHFVMKLSRFLCVELACMQVAGVRCVRLPEPVSLITPRRRIRACMRPQRVQAAPAGQLL